MRHLELPESRRKRLNDTRSGTTAGGKATTACRSAAVEASFASTTSVRAVWSMGEETSHQLLHFPTQGRSTDDRYAAIIGPGVIHEVVDGRSREGFVALEPLE